jgi:alkaline phosphatase D
MFSLNRRDFVAASAAATWSVASITPAAEPNKTDAPPTAIGPLLGHVDATTAIVWYRATAPGTYELKVSGEKLPAAQTYQATAAVEHDLCVTWQITGLSANQKYTAHLQTGSDPAAQPVIIRTPPPVEQPARVSIAMGSCASSKDFFEIWSQMAAQGADGVVLLGDTPYIDKTDLASNRAAHRNFLSIPTLQDLVRTRPLWATWDDHDFGGNDSDGKQMAKVKAGLRQVFMEYRGLKSYGDGQAGIYTNFRYGPLEVFLLDPRYFSQCEPSPVQPDKPTCLGKQQWEWLLKQLQASTAPFKLIATGQIWDDKKNKEKDDWETYSGEREALFDFIGQHQIEGVVLVGGDIHVSRRLRYPLKKRVGYDLEQWIVSPLHDRIIPSLNVPHPALLWGEAIPNVFLQVIADTTKTPASLTANWITMAGKIVHTVTLAGREMEPAKA